MTEPSSLFQLAATISRAHAEAILANEPRRLYAGNEIIPHKSDAELEALAAEQEIASRLRQVDYKLTADSWLEEMFGNDKHLAREIQCVCRDSLRARELGDMDYAVEVDVTDCPDAPEKFEVGEIRFQIGSCTERISVVMEVDARKTEVVGGRTLKTFVARVRS